MTRRRAQFPTCLALLLTLGLAARAGASGPADPLLKLVPPDAGVTLAVEDLRGHAREVLASPLAEGLRRLPAVQAWQAAGGFRRLRNAAAKVERLLGTDLPTIRDGLLGEAVVLTLWLPPGGAPDSARGMLLVRVPDPNLLDRLIEGVNAAQLKNGELRRVSERRRGDVVYHAREFPPGPRPDEYYSKLDDRVFAWSNSEGLIQGAIDRQQAGSGGLADVPVFREVRGGLPGRSAVALFVDPKFAGRLLAAAPMPAKPQEQRFLELVGRYLAAVRYAGAAVEWRGGFVLHTHELVDPARLGPGLKRWAARPEPLEPGLPRIPSTALAVATAQVDFGALLDALEQLIPEADRSRFDNFMLLLRGLMLGRDVRSAVAPNLGPGVTAYVEPPPAGLRFPNGSLVLAVRLAPAPEGAKTAEAVDNALRTVVAMAALDVKRGGGRLPVVTAPWRGATITSLDGTPPSAYTVHDGRVILGTPDAVARALDAQAGVSETGRFEHLRERFFPGASSYVCVDLRALYRAADPNRAALARRQAARQNRPEADALRDVDQALALIDLFEVAYLTSAIDPAFTSVHRALGLVARERP
jgi:hypothetical protein